MIFKQYYLGCLAHASYLIADEATKEAAVVDPQRDIDQYVRDAEELGLTIRHVFLTHFHADFLAGHLELRDRYGARIYLGAEAAAEYEFTPLKDGDSIQFGTVRLQALETPGHTPEGISLLVYDLASNAEKPHAVLTGDTLFIGDVGRPDLMASIGVTAEELANKLYDSLHEKLLKLPDETLVYPAHGAGSMCGKHLSSETSSTIGDQRKYNYALQPMSLAQFIELVAADQPEAPSYFLVDAMLNRKERQVLDESLRQRLKPLKLQEVLSAQERGAQILDVREPAEYAGAHLVGSLNIGLSGKYATWAGTLLDHDRPMVIVAEPGKEEEAAMRLGRIGFDNVAGFLEGGVVALDGQTMLIRKAERITAPTVAEQLASSQAPLIVDVRTPNEWKSGHIERSINLPLNQLRDRLGELPRDEALIVHCQSGYRSSIAYSLLEAEGYRHVQDMVGGITAWQAAQLETRQEEGATCSAGSVCKS